MRHRHEIESEDGRVVKKWSEHFESMNDKGYRIPSHKMGSRIFGEVPFPPEMEYADIGRLDVLCRRYLVGKTNMLGYRHRTEIKPYTTIEIGELVGLQERQAFRFVDKMLALKVLQKVQTNSGPQYYVNPAYFMANGQRLSLDLFLLFRDELKYLVPDWVMRDFLRQAAEKPIMKADVLQEAKEIVHEH